MFREKTRKEKVEKSTIGLQCNIPVQSCSSETQCNLSIAKNTIALKSCKSWPSANTPKTKTPKKVLLPKSYQKRASEFHSKLGYKKNPTMRSAVAVHQLWRAFRSPSTRDVIPNVIHEHKGMSKVLKSVMERAAESDESCKKRLHKDVRACIRLRAKRKYHDICKIKSSWRRQGLSVRGVARLTGTPMSTLQNYLKEIKPHKKSLGAFDKAQVIEFFSRNDVTLQLPSKRHAGKFFLRTAFHEQYERYCNLQVSMNRRALSKSAVLRILPKKKFKVYGKIPFQNCKCIRCENVKLAIAAVLQVGVSSVSRSLTVNCVVSCCSPPLVDLNQRGIYLCPRKCLLRECTGCRHRYSAVLSANNKKELLKKPCKYHQWVQDYKWEKGVRVKDVFRRQLFRGTVADLLGVLKLAMIALPLHIFLSKWQAKCMEDCRARLKPGEVLMVLDFAKNITLCRQREVQYAFFSRLSVTLHSIVMYYWCPQAGFCSKMITDEFMCLTPDLNHDAYAVQEFTKLAINHLRAQGVTVNKVYQFSDNQCAQYKSYVSFEFMFLLEELLDVLIEKHYTGAGHGKGPADGAVGRIKALIERAIRAGTAHIQNAHELFLFLQEHFCKALNDEEMCQHYRRSFAYVPEVDRSYEPISRTVPGTMKLHSVKNAGNGKLLVRDTSCFCRLLDTECIVTYHNVLFFL